MSKILDFFKNHYGYARMKDLKANGIHTREIKKLLEEGTIEKVKPGLYRLSTFSGIKIVSLVDICRAVHKGVICLLSALDYYDFTTFSPWEVHVAIPHDHKKPKIEYPPVRFFHFRENTYSLGIETINTEFGPIRIYNREKTVCDIFRFRNRLGEDLAIEALKNYLIWSNGNTTRLRKYMKITRTEKIMSPFIKGMMQT